MFKCPICESNFKNQNSLAGHINGNHKEFVPTQVELVCKMYGYGKNTTKIANDESIVFSGSFVKRTVNSYQDLVEKYRLKFAEELVFKFKSGQSTLELSKEYDLGQGKIREYMHFFLTKEEIAGISRSIKNKKISSSLNGKTYFVDENNKRNYVDEKPVYELTCVHCNEKFKYENKHRKCCSQDCANKYRARQRGLASVRAQADSRRSKNEKMFADLCIGYFDDVKTNEAIFNGWDADVIIEDLKVAIMWNGRWHYEKLTKKHSVKQVQNRDRIKIKEIIKCGYTPYIIKDLGRHNAEFVYQKFNDFIDQLQEIKGTLN